MHQRARALEEAVGQLQAEVDQARAELTEREAEERRLCLNVEQLEADLRSSKALTENLQTELNEKETKEVHMLEEKEEAIAQVCFVMYFNILNKVNKSVNVFYIYIFMS